jgi:hypothetical protein
MGQQNQVKGGSDFGWIILFIFLIGGIIFLFRKKGSKKRIVQKGGAWDWAHCGMSSVIIGLVCFIAGFVVKI